jgi:hypothetical protein
VVTGFGRPPGIAEEVATMAGYQGSKPNLFWSTLMYRTMQNGNLAIFGLDEDDSTEGGDR